MIKIVNYSSFNVGLELQHCRFKETSKSADDRLLIFNNDAIIKVDTIVNKNYVNIID